MNAPDTLNTYPILDLTIWLFQYTEFDRRGSRRVSWQCTDMLTISRASAHTLSAWVRFVFPLLHPLSCSVHRFYYCDGTSGLVVLIKSHCMFCLILENMGTYTTNLFDEGYYLVSISNSNIRFSPSLMCLSLGCSDMLEPVTFNDMTTSNEWSRPCPTFSRFCSATQ